MDQIEIDEAVATATGESISEVRRRGFTIATQFIVDDDHDPQVLDWESLDAARFVFP